MRPLYNLFLFFLSILTSFMHEDSDSIGTYCVIRCSESDMFPNTNITITLITSIGLPQFILELLNVVE